MFPPSTPPVGADDTVKSGSDRLDRILEWAVKSQQAAAIINPVLGGYVQLGIGLVKIGVGFYQAIKGPGEPDIPMPSDEELINKLEATSQRIVDKGTSFLNEGKGSSEGS